MKRLIRRLLGVQFIDDRLKTHVDWLNALQKKVDHLNSMVIDLQETIESQNDELRDLNRVTPKQQKRIKELEQKIIVLPVPFSEEKQ